MNKTLSYTCKYFINYVPENLLVNASIELNIGHCL